MQPPLPRINQQSYDRLVYFVRQHRLEQTDARIRALLATIKPQRCALIDVASWTQLQAIVQEYEAALQERPVLPAPADVLGAGAVTLCRQLHNDVPVMVSEAECSRHLHCIAGTGGGKTTFLNAVLGSLRITAPHVRILYLDQKDDWRKHAAEDEQCLILHPDLPVAMQTPPSGVRREDHLAHLRRCLLKIMYGAAHIEAVLAIGMDEGCKRHADAGLGDTFEVVEAMRAQKGTYQFLDSVTNTANRGANIRRLRPGMLARHGWTIEQLSRYNLYVQVSGLVSDADLLLFTWLVEQLYLLQRSRQQRAPLSWVVVMDEASTIWQARSASRIEGVPFLSETHSRVREYGISFWTTSTSSLILDRLFRSNIGIQVAMQLNNAAELRDVSSAMGLDRAAEELLRAMPPGQCLIRLPRWDRPILASFPPSPDKYVSHDLWQAAIDRTNDRTPKPPPPPASTKAPPRQRQLLNEIGEALLRHLCTMGISLVSDAYEAIGAHPQAADRERKNLEHTLGFISSSRITCHARRGGSGIALEPTPEGYAYLGVKPPHGTRGGDSAQHRWLVRTISAHLPGARVEATVACKSVDLLVRMKPEHQRFCDVLARHAHSLTMPPNFPTFEQLVAIEVEVSTPEATGPANVLANPVDLTIIAVFKHVLQTISALQAALSSDLYGRVLVIDALTLVDELRSPKRTTNA